MFWICPRCGRINHNSPFKCQCGQRVRQASSSRSLRLSRDDEDINLIDVIIETETFSSGSSDSYDSGSSDSGSCD